MKYKRYSKEETYSYTFGYYPTFELIKYKQDQLISVYLKEEKQLESETGQKLVSLLKDKTKLQIDKNIFNKVNCTENTYCLGIFTKYETNIDKDSDLICLQRPSDMGNLGTIIRTMDALSMHNLVLIKNHADYFDPKVIRASMGSIFKMNIVSYPNYSSFIKDYSSSHKIYPFMLQNSKPLQSVISTTHPYVLLFGNESTGLDLECSNDNNIKIEQDDSVDSLNLSIAVSIGLYHFKHLK